MDDLISRQAAIDALDEQIEQCNKSLSSFDISMKDEYAVKVERASLVAFREILEYLPPSQLGTNLAEVGKDAVSRKAVKELAYSQIRSMYCGVALKEQRETMLRIADNVIGLLAPVTSAHPEIVRCKDCKHWIPYDWMFGEVWQSKNIADYPEDEIGCNYCDMAMKANDFCSRGERRTDG